MTRHFRIKDATHVRLYRVFHVSHAATHASPVDCFGAVCVLSKKSLI